jgi:hypothetical protein
MPVVDPELPGLHIGRRVGTAGDHRATGPSPLVGQHDESSALDNGIRTVYVAHIREQ